MKIVLLSCSHCSNTFSRPKKEYDYAIRKGRRNFYCSRECSHKGNMVKRITKQLVCKLCGEGFEDEVMVTRPDRHKDFCSRKCANTYSSSFHEYDEKFRERVSASVGKIAQNRTKRAKKKYKDNPNLCVVCESAIPFDLRYRKTCSDDCYSTRISNVTSANPNCGGSTGRSHGCYYYNKWQEKEVWLDSTWEKLYAEYLDDQGIKWIRPSYLPWDDNGKIRKYFPDFYLVESDEYVDVKNPYLASLKATHRKLRLVREHNEVIVKIISQSDLESLNLI